MAEVNPNVAVDWLLVRLLFGDACVWAHFGSTYVLWLSGDIKRFGDLWTDKQLSLLSQESTFGQYLVV